MADLIGEEDVLNRMERNERRTGGPILAERARTLGLCEYNPKPRALRLVLDAVTEVGIPEVEAALAAVKTYLGESE
jgi:hypothetical protein